MLQDFAQQAENIFRGSDRRTDLDKAYGKLISAIFEQISRLAAESQKTPSDVVLFGRWHHLHFTPNRHSSLALRLHLIEML